MSTLRNAPARTRRAYPFRPPRVTESSQSDSSFILKDLADKVAKFKRSTDDLSPVDITNMKPIASYSWIEAATPTIAVPESGSPAPIASDEKDFRIDVDMAGSTCLFTRLEAQSHRTRTVQGFMGYGHEYEKAATRVTRGCERATGHHRMISVDIGELKILLRFTIEACTSSAGGTDGGGDLLAAFSGLVTVPTVRGVSITQTTPRKVVPQASLIELKTRAAHRELDWAEVYPRLYLSRTAFLYIAKHERGNFNTLEKIELGSESMRFMPAVLSRVSQS
ncbi:hypothetical protein EDB19DRAFT_1915270 [Suillus lakei]|nr:hypothetical protein EDB19DRAFT_1915270 [Suillus lakei]